MLHVALGAAEHASVRAALDATRPQPAALEPPRARVRPSGRPSPRPSTAPEQQLALQDLERPPSLAPPPGVWELPARLTARRARSHPPGAAAASGDGQEMQSSCAKKDKKVRKDKTDNHYKEHNRKDKKEKKQHRHPRSSGLAEETEKVDTHFFYIGDDKDAAQMKDDTDVEEEMTLSARSEVLESGSAL
ncbi:unnamed protein product, partial [Prorocentrum cordatum]